MQAAIVSVHRAPHLLCCRALEVQGVRLHTLRLAYEAPCKRLQFGGKGLVVQVATKSGCLNYAWIIE